MPFLRFIDLFFFERFIQGSPLLSEFENRILFYRDLQLKINSEAEYITVGALALFTGERKSTSASLPIVNLGKMTSHLTWISWSQRT